MFVQPASLDPDALFTESQASEFLQISVRTLQAWRVRGGGPPFVKCGRSVRYRRRDLLSWVDQETVEHTSGAHNGGNER